MPDLILTRRIRVGGVLTSATSVVLANPGNTAGVTRDDTGAVVVASGTAMVETSTGVYQYTISGAALGVVYRWYPRVVLDGATYQDEKTATAAAAIDLPTYLTVDEAKALVAQLYGLTRVAAASDADLAKLLPAATARVDAAHRWQGRKYDATQTLEFPRTPYDDSRVWEWDATTSTAIVPVNVERAVLHEAESMLDTTADKVAKRIAAGIASISTGSLSESYNAAMLPNGRPKLCPDAERLLALYVLRTGRLL